MIDFKTYEEQIEILKNRGLVINNENDVKIMLTKENYYNVINGYKDLFIINHRTVYERFKKGVCFEEVYSLYQFDRQLKNIFLKNILSIENTFKAVLAYVFSKNHKDGNYYIDTNFDNSTTNVKHSVKTVLTKIKNTIDSQLQNGNKMLEHYDNKYSRIPLWVAVNVLSLGETNKLFVIMKQKDKIEISKILSSITRQTIYANEVGTFLHELTLIRNICEHDQRLYCFESYLNISEKNKIYKALNLNAKPKRLYPTLIILKHFLEDKEFKTLCFEINNAFNILEENLCIIQKSVILNKMGFVPDWLKIATI